MFAEAAVFVTKLPEGGPARPLPLTSAQDYSVAMIQLPASYQEYLAGKSESFINAIRPVLMQSAADRLHGVRVVFHPHDHQAHLDDSIPYGTVVEDID
jgi:hypothetical protein